MKSVKWSSIFISICYMAAGILFFMYPNSTQNEICKYLAYASLSIGSLEIIIYFLRSKQDAFFKNDFVVGLLLITFGILAIWKTNLFDELVYFVLAIIIMLSGYIKLQDSVDSWRLGSSNGFLYFILAIISIAIGLIVIINGPKMKTLSLDYMVAAGLIYSGFSDFISSIFLSIKMSGYIKDKKQKALEKEAKKQEEKIEEIPEDNIEEEISVEEFDEEIQEEKE